MKYLPHAPVLFVSYHSAAGVGAMLTDIVAKVLHEQLLYIGSKVYKLECNVCNS